MKIQEFFKKNKAGAIIGGSYFLVAYYLMGANMSITGELLGFAGSAIGPFAFWIDFAVAALVGALLQKFIDGN